MHSPSRTTHPDALALGPILEFGMSTFSAPYVLITGASSGIGRATALAFAKAGYAVGLLGRSEDRLAAVAESVQNSGGTAHWASIDLEQIDPLPGRLASLLELWGPPAILVNNAGIAYTGDLATMPLVDLQRVLNLNLVSLLACIQAVLPGMRQQQQGLIINVGSIAAHQAFPDWGAYCASKAAMVSLSKCLAAEERGHGIRVTVVSPGSVNTPLWDTDTVQADFDRSQMLTPEIVADTILHTALLPPQAVVEELTLYPSAGAL